jgi:peptide/nickel transport system permease protein
MRTYLLHRLLHAIPVLIGISVIAFFIVRWVPGDTVTAMLGAQYSEEEAIALREKYGLDQPLPLQYLRWAGNVLRGDFGRSAFTGQPVLEAILERLPVTAQLVAMSLTVALACAIPLGIWAALRRGGKADTLASVTGLLGVSIPGFWLGALLILGFSLHGGWLPSGGYIQWTVDPWENLRHMTLPALALGGAVTAVILRMTRSAMLDVLDEEYVRFARSLGFPQRVWVTRYALRNALIPIITITGIQAGYLLGGSVVIEHMFSLPGIGLLSLQAINNRDYALLQGTVLFVGVCFVFINLLVDFIYAWLDPGIKY